MKVTWLNKEKYQMSTGEVAFIYEQNILEMQRNEGEMKYILHCT